jgi:LmbE family N-acetylglucosaminyl deacetylase
MNVLAIGAHFDDVELGCGGALARHVKHGDYVYVYVATKSGFVNHEKKQVRDNNVANSEAQVAMKILGVTKMHVGNFSTLEVEFVDALNIDILKIIEKNKIDIVYTHWDGDIHHDHKAVSMSSLHSCRHVPRLLMYRSNWYHSTQNFHGNFYIDITDYIEIKEKAISAHASEMDRTGRTWIDFFRNESKNAGQKIGVKYAEVFEVVKWLEFDNSSIN